MSLIQQFSGNDKKVTKVEAYQWFNDNFDLVHSTIEVEGFATEPRPLIPLADRFKIYKDEL